LLQHLSAHDVIPPPFVDCRAVLEPAVLQVRISAARLTGRIACSPGPQGRSKVIGQTIDAFLSPGRQERSDPVSIPIALV